MNRKFLRYSLMSIGLASLIGLILSPSMYRNYVIHTWLPYYLYDDSLYQQNDFLFELVGFDNFIGFIAMLFLANVLLLMVIVIVALIRIWKRTSKPAVPKNGTYPNSMKAMRVWLSFTALVLTVQLLWLNVIMFIPWIIAHT